MKDRYENYSRTVDVKVEAYKRAKEAEAALEALNKCMDDYAGYFFEQYEFDWVDNGFMEDIRNRLLRMGRYAQWINSEMAGLAQEAKFNKQEEVA